MMMLMGVWKLWPRTKTKKVNREVSVVTSFYPLYFFASEIGGDKIRVKNVTPAGSEPHDYEPTARDMAEIQESQLLILNGNGLEAWAQKIRGEVEESGVKVIEAGEGWFEKNDPHIWLSPELAKKQAETILAGLVQIDPENAIYYQERGKRLSEEIERVQTEFRQGLAHCNKREMVTSHEAFAYLAREFGLTQVSIAGLSPDEEPSTKQMAEAARFAQEKKIKFIFFESITSPKLSETIAEEIGAKTLVLDPIEGISESDREQGKNYLTVMRENLVNLKIALECQ
jgi:zinc transport system substrate-binding protein